MFQKWIEMIDGAWCAFRNKVTYAINGGNFDAVAFIEKTRTLPWGPPLEDGPARTTSGAFGIVADARLLRGFKAEQLDTVLNLVYSNYLSDSVRTLNYGDEKAPAVRMAYISSMENQKFFDLLVCGSVMGFYKQGLNIVENDGLLYSVLPELSTAVNVRNSFQSLKEEITRGDSSVPWVQDCAKTFTVERFSKWLDFQIAGAEASVPNFSSKPLLGEQGAGSLSIEQDETSSPAEPSVAGSSRRARHVRSGTEVAAVSVSLASHAEFERPKVSPRDAFYASYDKMAPIYG